jgi:hypothetical protein
MRSNLRLRNLSIPLTDLPYPTLRLISVLLDDVQRAQGLPELHQFPAVAEAAYSHRREAESADQLVEIYAGSGVVAGVEHHLAAVAVARIGA